MPSRLLREQKGSRESSVRGSHLPPRLEFIDNPGEGKGVVKLRKSTFGGVRSATLRRESISGQAEKGARWMPWHGQARKGAISCEKLRGAARRQ